VAGYALENPCLQRVVGDTMAALLAYFRFVERMINFLESLVAEWYQYGEKPPYFVRLNTRIHKLKTGGWGGEIDVLAYSPSRQQLVHIETSSDADSWEKRKERFRKKFDFPQEEYETLVDAKGITVEKIALVGWTGAPRIDLNWVDKFGGVIRVQSVPEFLKKITVKLQDIPISKEAVSECFPLLRAMQFALHFRAK
jgi:hypothetical protein